MSIRLRLAIWYAGFLAVVFGLSAPLVYVTTEATILSGMDHWLTPTAVRLVAALESEYSQIYPAPISAQSLSELTPPGVLTELLDRNGRPMEESSEPKGPSISVPDASFATAWWGTPSSFTAIADGHRWRAVLAPIPGDQEPRGFVVVASSLQEADEALSRLRLMLIAGAVTLPILAVAVGWWIARAGLHPIEEMSETARAIALSQGLGRRLKVGKSEDEVSRLARTLNEMLASLDAAHETQRRFVADASHELRSPLTSIRSNIEFLRRALDAPTEVRAEALADVEAELERLTRLTSDLLLLAKADAGYRMEMDKVDLRALVLETHRQKQAPASGVTLELGEVQPARVVGSSAWLKQLLLILLDNALKYTPQGGRITLALGREAGQAVLRVSDTGIGIAPEDLPNIFERFYRADKARARDEGGSGLGLAIARWIVDAHGCEIEVESQPGKGSTFTVRLPAV